MFARTDTILKFIALMAMLAIIPSEVEARNFMIRVIGHPRLYFTAPEIPSLRKTNFSAEKYLHEKEMNIAYYGGQKLTFELPPVQPGHLGEPPGFDSKSFGHYPYWTQLSRQIEDRLESLSLAYQTTGNPEYADTAIQYCLSLSKWKSWTDLDYGPNTCLDTAHFTFGVSMAYDLCHDRMTADQQATIRHALMKLGLEPLLKDSPRHTEDNLQMLRNAGLGIGGCAILGEEDRAPAYIRSAYNYFKWYLDHRAVSSNTEGLLYSNYAMENCIRFADVLNRTTGDNSLINHPYMTQFIQWVTYFDGPGGSGCTPFEDCAAAKYFGFSMRILTRALNNPLAKDYLQRNSLVEDKTDIGVLYPVNPVKIETKINLPPSALFKNIGWVSMRSGWNDTDTLLSFQCGNSKMGHDHKAQGNFVLNCGGEWLITDPGYGSFNGGAESFFGRNTVGHNCILIDGAGQNKLGGGEITQFFRSALLDFGTGDATGSYPEDTVNSVVRKIVFLRPDCFVIYDKVVTPKASLVESLVRTDKKGSLIFEDGAKEPNADASWFLIDKPKASVKVDLLLPIQKKLSLTHYPGAESFGDYLSLSPIVKTTQTEFLSVLQPRPKTGEHIQTPYETPYLLKTAKGQGTIVRLDKRTLLFGDPGYEVTAGAVSLQGTCGLICYDPQSAIAGYAAVDSLELRMGSDILLRSKKPASVSMEFTANRFEGTVESRESTYIQLAVKHPTNVLLDGKPAVIQTDTLKKYMTLRIPAGSHKINGEVYP